MKDETLLKLSVGIAILGILGLFLYGQNTGPTGYSIYELEDNLGKQAEITGMVTYISISKAGHTFLQVTDGTGQIKVVAFESSGIDTSWIKKGSEVEIIGEISEYKGELEIIASEIKPNI